MINTSFHEALREFNEKKTGPLARYGHLVEGVKHYSNSDELNQLERAKLACMIDVMERTTRGSDNLSYDKYPDIQALREATHSTNAQSFVTVALPMITRVFPAMISREFVSVQPISQPTANIFYLDVKKSNNSPKNSVADDIDTDRTYSDNIEYDIDNSTPSMKDLELTITGTSVSATEKKLRARWTQEAQQDIMAYHGLSAETILTGALSQQVVREWDRMVIAKLIADATGGSATFSMTQPAGLSYEDRKFWMETIFEKCLDVDNAIFTKRYRRTNFMIVPANVGTFMNKANGFQATDTDVNAQIVTTGGRYYAGTLQNRWRVYIDPFLTGKILMGYNNPSDWTDTAFVLAPYIPLYLSAMFQDPNTLHNVKAVMSRMAMVTTVPNLLGTVTITGS